MVVTNATICTVRPSGLSWLLRSREVAGCGVHSYNLSTQEAEARRAQVQGQLGLHSRIQASLEYDIFSKKKNQKIKEVEK
jgi:hypothetical protein